MKLLRRSRIEKKATTQGYLPLIVLWKSMVQPLPTALLDFLILILSGDNAFAKEIVCILTSSGLKSVKYYPQIFHRDISVLRINTIKVKFLFFTSLTVVSKHRPSWPALIPTEEISLSMMPNIKLYIVADNKL